MKHQIWSANWTFYKKQTAKEKKDDVPVITFTVENIVTPYIPVRFVINEGDAYKRAIRGNVVASMMGDLENNKETGLKKFTITYVKQIQGLS